MKKRRRKNLERNIIITVISILSTLFSISFYFWIRQNIFGEDIQLMLITSGILLALAVTFGWARWNQIQKKL